MKKKTKVLFLKFIWIFCCIVAVFLDLIIAIKYGSSAASLSLLSGLILLVALSSLILAFMYKEKIKEDKEVTEVVVNVEEND